MRRRRYVLTARAAADLREARAWSLARWGRELTNRYFDDLHEGVERIAESMSAMRGRADLTGDTALLIYPVREHYIVYEPLGERFIAVVAVIRQRRDIPAILQRWAAAIRRDLLEIRARVERGEIVVATRASASRSPRKKK